MTVMMVRRTAKDLCGAFYEMNRTDRFRKFWPDQKQYIARNWPDFVEEARTSLAGLLGQSTTPDYLKRQIFEALEDDNERTQSAYVGDHAADRMILKPDEPGQIEQELFWKH
jgi:hypothetical protein